jgi:DNA-binding NarL/FixJ family response regulator
VFDVSDMQLGGVAIGQASGMEVIKQARQQWPQCDVMVVTVFGDKANILAAINAGALGYLFKDITAEQPASPPQLSSTPAPQSEALTAREYEILVMANKGFSYEEVALKLGISIHTVRTHVKRSYAKLQVNSKTQALYELKRMGKYLS